MVLPQRAGAASWAFLNRVFCNMWLLNLFMCDDCMYESPCLNNGVCKNNIWTGYQCDCAGTGFNGDTCENNINYCNPDSCENGGTCTDGDGVNEYSCECTLPYKGDSCELCQIGFEKEGNKCKLIKDPPPPFGTSVEEWTVTGTGQKNGEFTMLEAFGVEIAIRAFQVGWGPYKAKQSTRGHPQCGLYEVDAGTSSGGRAWWNIDYSVDLRDGYGYFQDKELGNFEPARLTFECVFGKCWTTPPVSPDKYDIPLASLSGTTTLKQGSLIPTTNFGNFDPTSSLAIYECCLELNPDFLDDDLLKVCIDIAAEV